MPNIVFRCAYCNQLMKIGSRKTGSVVTCPKCANQIVVPTPEEGARRNDGSAPSGGGGVGLFDQGDFDKVLSEEAAAPQMIQPHTLRDGPGALGARPGSSVGLDEYEAIPLGPPKKLSRGIYFTAAVLTVLSVLVLVALGMAFLLGFLVGRSS
jgi:hypothetical protein